MSFSTSSNSATTYGMTSSDDVVASSSPSLLSMHQDNEVKADDPHIQDENNVFADKLDEPIKLGENDFLEPMDTSSSQSEVLKVVELEEDEDENDEDDENDDDGFRRNMTKSGDDDEATPLSSGPEESTSDEILRYDSKEESDAVSSAAAAANATAATPYPEVSTPFIRGLNTPRPMSPPPKEENTSVLEANKGSNMLVDAANESASLKLNIYRQIKSLPWRPKVRQCELEAFLDQERKKFLGYGDLVNDLDTLVGLPHPIHESVKILKQHLFASLSEEQIKLEEKFYKYPLSTNLG